MVPCGVSVRPVLAAAAALLAACGTEPSGPDFAAPAERSFSTAGQVQPGGTLLGIARTGASAGVDFVRIDVATGAVEADGALPLGGSFFGGAAYDADQQRYFTSGPALSDPTQYFLATVSAATGVATLAENPYPTSIPTAIAYDPASKSLIGSARIDGRLRVVRVDPATGSITSIVDHPLCGISGKGALDADGGRYFVVGPVDCMGGDQVVATVDLASGTATVSPPIRPFLNGIVYDPVGQALLGISRVRAGAEMQLVRVDLATGAMTEVAGLPLQGLASAAAALDAAGRRFFAIGPVASQMSLVVADVATGAVLHAHPLTHVPHSLQFQPARSIPQILTGLRGEVEALLATGALGAGQAGALTSKLDAALASLDRDNARAAIGQIRAFANQCEALVRGRVLSAAQGQALVDAAAGVLQQLRSS